MKITLLLKMMSLLKGLTFYMILAVLLGTIGHLLAFGLGILGTYALLSLLPMKETIFQGVPFGGYSTSTYVWLLFFCAILRGIFHYVEQYFNHLIAFKVLASIRQKVFRAMAKLAPAKIQTENKGKLLSVIMGDIELMEVFYAHTVSPVFIALCTTILLFFYQWALHPVLAVHGLFYQGVLGVALPLYIYYFGKKSGQEVREKIGGLQGILVDELYGIEERMQFQEEDRAREKIDRVTKDILARQKALRLQMAKASSTSGFLISLSGVTALLLSSQLYFAGKLSSGGALLSVVTIMSTFGPYVSLAALGNLLTGTLASGKRVLALLAEEPLVPLRSQGKEVRLETLQVEDVGFDYGEEEVLQRVSLSLRKGEILGIHGASGSGKSTLLKLLMEFWPVNTGQISINGEPLRHLKSNTINDNMDYLTQSAELFKGTLKENLQLARPDATEEELWEAIEKASLTSFVRSLPQGLDQRVEELGDNFSGGEKQRIGLARCFLSRSPLLLLDEPTSNLDTYNEAVILRALCREKGEKTMILVSHRASSLAICDRLLKMEEGRLVR